MTESGQEKVYMHWVTNCSWACYRQRGLRLWQQGESWTIDRIVTRVTSRKCVVTATSNGTKSRSRPISPTSSVDWLPEWAGVNPGRLHIDRRCAAGATSQLSRPKPVAPFDDTMAAVAQKSVLRSQVQGLSLGRYAGTRFRYALSKP